MAGDWFKKAADALGQVRDKATEVVSEQQASFVRGKTAGSTVRDDSGMVIVDSGHVIDDSVIERAAASGKLAQLSASVAKAQAQDLKEKAQDAYERTDSGQERRALDSVDQFVRARAYVGKYAGMDVTDIRGTVLIPMGTQIKDEHVSAARDAGQLGALIYAAQQPLPEGFVEAKEAESAQAQYEYREAPTYHRPKPLPLVSPQDSPSSPLDRNGQEQ
jgi:hypothetical protein